MSRIIVLTEETQSDPEARGRAEEVARALRRLHCDLIELPSPLDHDRPWWFDAWPEIARDSSGLVVVTGDGCRMNALFDAVLSRTMAPGPFWVIGTGVTADGLRQTVRAHRGIVFLPPYRLEITDQALEFLNLSERIRQQGSIR